MTRVEEIFERAMAIEEDELRTLWELLSERLGVAEEGTASIHESWLVEIRERQRRIADGTDQTVPWAEVRERMFQRVGN